MHDLLKFLSLLQTLSSGPNLLRSFLYISLAIFVYYLWGYDAVWAKVISFLVVDIALYFLIVIFLSNPLELIKYSFLKMFFLLLSALRIGIKLILIAISFVISIVYFISPIDIVPDILLGIGWIDDILLAVGLVSYAANSDLQIPDYSFRNNEEGYPIFKSILAISISTATTYYFRYAL